MGYRAIGENVNQWVTEVDVEDVMRILQFRSSRYMSDAFLRVRNQYSHMMLQGHIRDVYIFFFDTM